jgi:carboxypeptidase T
MYYTSRFFISLLIMLLTGAYVTAQDYSRVAIFCTPEQMPILAQTGIAIDHPVLHTKYKIVCDLSAQEHQLAKTAGFNTEVLIPDLQQWMLEKLSSESGMEQEILEKAASLPVPPGFNFGTMGGYLKYAEILLELDSMQQLYPNLISAAQTIGYSYEGRPILAFRISDNPNIDENEPEVLYTALHHAREPNSLMQMMYYMHYILSSYGTDPEVTCLLDSRELYFVPVLNPDGYIFNETTNPNGGGMWRKNRRDNLDGTFGVDLNRNYAANWGFDNTGSSPNTGSDTYRGTSGFSEPETQAMRDYCNSREFRLTLNYHTFGNLLIYPFGYIPNLLTPDSNTYTAYAKLLTAENNYKYGTGVETVGYVTNGDSDDWMYSEQTTKNKIFSMTPEAGDPQDGFWPPMSQILPFCEDNLRANLIHAWLGGTYVTASNAIHTPLAGAAAFLPIEFTNYGQDSAIAISATLELIDANVISVTNTIQLNNLGTLNTTLDSFQINFASGIPEGTFIRVVVHTHFANCYSAKDTIGFYYGTPNAIYTYDFENGTGTWTGTWALTTADSYSPVNSMTDSPNGDYPSNANRSITMGQNIDLTGYVSPRLEFFARWRIEKGYDFVQCKISVNNGPWVALAGNHTVSGASDQIPGAPLYDGVSAWVKEVIDLASYAGQQVKFRFTLESDPWVEDEGYYFDDFQILGYGTGPIALNSDVSAPVYSLYPNPAQREVWISDVSASQITAQSLTLRLYDVFGRLCLEAPVESQKPISIQNFADGVYVFELHNSSGSTQTGKLVILNTSGR